MRFPVLVTAIFAIAIVGRLRASPCIMTASYDVQAEQALPIWRHGERKEISLYAVNDHTKAKSFCTSDGYCYPASVYVNGHRVEALGMTNCRITPGGEPYDDLYSTSYTVESTPLRIPTRPSDSQPVTKDASSTLYTQLLFGKCTAQSFATFSGFGQDATQDKHPFRCDRATVEFLDRHYKRLRITFPPSLDSGEPSSLGFTGVRSLHGQTVSLSTFSLGTSKLSVTESTCKLFLDGANLKGIVCQANYVGIGKYDVAVVFEASPGQSLGPDDDEGP